MNVTIKKILSLLGSFIFIAYPTVSCGVSDCAWTGYTIAWIDSNKNGILDLDEKPLQGVSVHVDDTKNKYIDVADPVQTDDDGEAYATVWLPGCPKVELEVYIDTPQGYQLTTQPRIKVDKSFLGTLDAETVYYFGFVVNQ